ncbi:hypothetical protein MPTK1_1g18220 [Marchantia polymorpha subsp. ruderalis]|uniref:PAR1 protein n=2 Tax=Marchantia polymorpha TaxID=3197 RepID=A0A176WCT9_MARPO|nr:hypothetical protein AXG93_773s1660 [Marchantia polymorpha subsp. ruderalis]PTQ50118.1 hypothetical protein MARPO_0001s0160 [Marchantia polymorpha]BBM99043.1 hypothetical protein Mp_1g18220 [Marchantia polymorpha subsp. ruderalis]|eukprot:PTQ50118.1 hypothetical protein MARPO_0001s0160 [Marchantia polymorpha]
MSITTRAAFVALVSLLSLTAAPSAVRGQEGDLLCHLLPVEQCAFAVDSNGYRCVLERILSDDTYICQTSSISVGEESPVEYIETDHCIAACGAERMTVGFSTDVFSTRGFTTKLCSPDCRDRCSNLADLYSNMVAGEGVTLAELCGEHKRSMLMSEYSHEYYDDMAPAPAPGPAYGAPAPSPSDSESDWY